MAATTTSLTAIQTICRAFERVAPLRLAEKWDNVGLLLEAPTPRPNANEVLVTIDLTTAVVEEALSSPTSVIIAYHPPIFKGLTSLTLQNPLQRSLLRCVEKGISIYSPHTSIDSVWGGVNDWLADVIYGAQKTGGARTSGACKALVGEKLDKEGESEGAEGRLLTFEKPVTMEQLETRIKKGLNLKHIQVGYGTLDAKKAPIRTVAICAGSGGSMLVGKNADLYFTGEMSHHEILASVASGRNVILCGHDNTERGYLPTLAQRIQEELKTIPGDVADKLKVVVSAADRHPLQTV